MRNAHLILLLAASLLPLATAQAAPADLPETGRTTCLDPAGGFVIPCGGTGQDGEHRAGVAWPDPRFVPGTGATVDCVTDRLTGLMWVRAPGTTPTTWAAALADANALSLCGFSDWRLPNVNELESLVSSEAQPAAFLNAQGFSGVQPDFYWSSTSAGGAAGNAWLVNMTASGTVNNFAKSSSARVWPVRAGQ